MTLSRSEHAARHLRAAIDTHALWNLEANVRDLVSGFEGIAAENAALRKKLDAVRSIVRHLREEAEQSRYAMYASAYTTAAEWLEEALDGGGPS